MSEDAKQWQQWFSRELQEIQKKLAWCEGQHRKDEQRIEALEKTDRIAISGGKECDRRYVELRKRVEAIEERAANLEEAPGPDFGPVFRRIEALEKIVGPADPAATDTRSNIERDINSLAHVLDHAREHLHDRIDILEKIVLPSDGSCFPAPRDLSGPLAALCVRVEALEKRETSGDIAMRMLRESGQDIYRPRTCSTCRWYKHEYGRGPGSLCGEYGKCIRHAKWEGAGPDHECGDHEFRE